MKKIIALLTIVLSILWGVVALAEGGFYMTTVEVNFGSNSGLYVSGINKESVMERKLVNMGISSSTMSYVSDRNVIEYVMIHKEPLDIASAEAELLRPIDFEIKDVDGNVLMDVSHISDAQEFNCDKTMVVDEYGQLDVNTAFDVDANGNAVLVPVAVTDVERYLVKFYFNDAGIEAYANMTESLANRGEGKNYYYIYVNGAFLQRYKADGRQNDSSIWAISPYKDLIWEASNIMYTKSSFLPKSVKFIEANKFVDITCSPWATDGVFFMNTYGLVDFEDSADYTQPVTRGEFCRYTAHVIENYIYRSADEYREMESYREPFVDTDSPEVAMLYEIGIIKGKSDKEFAPEDTLTREEAAAIMCRIYKYVSGSEMSPAEGYTFADDDAISSWSKNEVYCAYALDLMKGVGDNSFNPSGIYTTEQSFVTLKQLRRALSKALYNY